MLRFDSASDDESLRLESGTLSLKCITLTPTELPRSRPAPVPAFRDLRQLFLLNEH